jgi:hypothetical protein
MKQRQHRQSNVMEEYNVKAYIPKQILYSTGIISGVPDDITMAEVSKKHPVNGVERIRKYNRTTKEMDGHIRREDNAETKLHPRNDIRLLYETRIKAFRLQTEYPGIRR